ncbi:MAG: putative bifunctional diguanylate cyclase/phosphodiesterase [Christensenellaceae bacterium]
MTLTLDIEAALNEEGSSGYIVFLDIKNFKSINNHFSHSIGDKVLREAAYQLSKVSGDLPVYNYDVDQFVIIVKNAGKEETRSLIERITDHFGNRLDMVEGLHIYITFSIAAVAYFSNMAIDQLLLDTDLAMQLIKYDTKEPYFFFDGASKSEALEKNSVQYDLIRSIENGFEGFMLFYQPIIRSKTGLYAGAEALLRWKNKDGKIVPPDITIPIIEQSGRMSTVENWVIETACRQCRDWILLGAPHDFFVSVNLSPSILGREGLHDIIMQHLQKNDLTRSNIILEVIESSTVLDSRASAEALRFLQSQKMRVAIDDFGTGYSSLAYLNTLPVNEVKIDRSFVTGIDKHASSMDFLSSIISMVASMGFYVCVEGVETQAQADLLKYTATDYLQGFLFGRPVPPEEFCEKYLQ